MKTLASSLFLFLFCVAGAQNWIPLNSGVTTKLNDVFFVSRDTGFVVGNDSVLLRTFDGGSTWTRMPNIPNSYPGNINSIWMFGPDTAFVSPEFQGGVPRTLNGGMSWTALSASNPCFPDGLFFAAQNNGFLYGTGCFGGAMIAHWNGVFWSMEELLDYTYLASGSYVGIRGVANNPSSNATVAVCDYGKIFRSTDNFQTWDTIVINDTTDFTAIDYAGNNTFYATTTGQFHEVYVSHDDGLTFAVDPNFVFTFYYPQFQDIDMLDNGFGIAGGLATTGNTGFLQIRNATGWGFQYAAVPQIIHAVYVVDSTWAFAVGDSGAIYRYDNITGIESWSGESQQLQLFPSVVQGSDVVTVQLPLGDAYVLEVFDVQGRLCASYTNCSGAFQFSTPETMTAGIYCVRASGARAVAVGRLLVR